MKCKYTARYQDTCIGDTRKPAKSIPMHDTFVMCYEIDTDSDTKVSRDTYRR